MYVKRVIRGVPGPHIRNGIKKHYSTGDFFLFTQGFSSFLYSGLPMYIHQSIANRRV